MMKKSGKTKLEADLKKRASKIYERLRTSHPDAHCALRHRNAFELLAATILSAQCTDVRVNLVTPDLFRRFPNPAAMAAANPSELEQLIRSTGFFRNKAKSLRLAAREIVARFRGQVPRTMDELTSLHGIARKTANVVLGNAFALNEGVVVDTHVTRLSRRMGLSRENDPVKIERDLMRLYSRERWTLLAHLLIEHGRKTCQARKPKCDRCPVSKLCPRIDVAGANR